MISIQPTLQSMYVAGSSWTGWAVALADQGSSSQTGKAVNHWKLDKCHQLALDNVLLETQNP
jgi:hypothetical protein